MLNEYPYWGTVRPVLKTTTLQFSRVSVNDSITMIVYSALLFLLSCFPFKSVYTELQNKSSYENNLHQYNSRHFESFNIKSHNETPLNNQYLSGSNLLEIANTNSKRKSMGTGKGQHRQKRSQKASLSTTNLERNGQYSSSQGNYPTGQYYNNYNPLSLSYVPVPNYGDISSSLESPYIYTNGYSDGIGNNDYYAHSTEAPETTTEANDDEEEEDEEEGKRGTEEPTTEKPTTTTTLAPFTLADVKVPAPFLRIEYMISFTFFGLMYGLGFFVLFQSLCVPAAKITVYIVYIALLKLGVVDPVTLEQALEQLPPT